MSPRKRFARLFAAGAVTITGLTVWAADKPTTEFRATGGAVSDWQPRFRAVATPAADVDTWKKAPTPAAVAEVAPAALPVAAPAAPDWKPAIPVVQGPVVPAAAAEPPIVIPVAPPQPTASVPGPLPPPMPVPPVLAPAAPTMPLPPIPDVTAPPVEVTAPAELPVIPPAPPAVVAPVLQIIGGPASTPGTPDAFAAPPPTPGDAQPPAAGTPAADPAVSGLPAPCPPAPQKPRTWHGNTYRVLPLAPPGANTIAPTGPGFYTVLAQIRNDYQEKPPRWPYPRGGPFPTSFNEIDFTYLDAIPFEDRDWAEKMKRIPLGNSFLFSTGGELRYRYNYETNSRLSGKTNIYDLFRGRLYGDLWYEDTVRLYTELLYADTLNQDLAPLTRDVNRGDFQQLFVDLKVLNVGGNPVYVRAGRQELLYGSQRLVSTNDWGDNRTRFDGVKAFYRSDTLDADAFLTRPTQVRFGQLDPSDHNQTFSGLWTTYKPKQGTYIDLYYLNLDNVNPGVARGQFRTGGFNVSTFGARYYSKFDSGLLLDFEGMQQFGHWADQSILAQAMSAYVGWNFKDVWAKPTIWFGYDYASGDPDPNNTGQHRTFNQLFQFGHYYYGFMDVTGGQNIRDWNVQAYAYPVNWLTTGIQYHIFRLDSNKDALYNFAGQVLRQDRTGRAGNDVGSELDLLLNFHLTDRQDIFINYCHFFTGTFIQATGPGMPLDYVYLQYSMRW
jgi:hypothetical protein